MPARPPAPALSNAQLAPGLYLVATPIGNLRDITLRALDILAAVDRVLAEDTRVTGRLLAAYGIRKPLERYDDHAGARIRPRVLAELAAGGRIALCSDAGTPLVSDPGYRLVREAVAQGVSVTPAPGASAVLAALAASGLPTDRFLFAGFPPPKPAARRAFLETLRPIRATLVLFEGAPRLGASLADMAAVLGAREAVVARELTKLHETLYRDRLDALAAAPALAAPKGEIVIVIAPGEAEPAGEAEVGAALTEALARLPPAKAAAAVAARLGVDRKALYRRALAAKDGR
ncbi:MAG TPA: 16S rRNA (cytidine(1402)-2'-O)-methyltransferase [Caulobacteraceae bacterium]|nr:16S rRNA (cytidine(1402)-2'-O)-methyltransferase [Caulobacteraceae bacterium]